MWALRIPRCSTQGPLGIPAADQQGLELCSVLYQLARLIYCCAQQNYKKKLPTTPIRAKMGFSTDRKIRLLNPLLRLYNKTNFFWKDFINHNSRLANKVALYSKQKRSLGCGWFFVFENGLFWKERQKPLFLFPNRQHKFNRLLLTGRCWCFWWMLLAAAHWMAAATAAGWLLSITG